MTLKKLAELTGVSVATISRVVNNKEGVGDEKREEIWNKLKEVGYKPKNSRNKSNKKIAVISTNIENEFFAELLRKISKTFFKKGVEVAFYDTFESFDTEYEIVSSFDRNQYDGVLICISDPEKSYKSIEILREKDIPFVLYDRELDRNSDGVFLDDFEAGMIASNYLIERGHKKILLLSAKLGLRTVVNRINGSSYAAKASSGIEVVHYEWENGEDIYDFVKNTLNKEKDFTGVVSAFRFISMGVIKYINSLSEDKKSKIDLVGFDNPQVFKELGIEAGNVTRSMNEMARLCVELLEERMDKKSKGLKKYLVQPYLEK